jgi:hypothetical protein
MLGKFKLSKRSTPELIASNAVGGDDTGDSYQLLNLKPE